MNHSPFVSIIVPIYNAAKFLQNTLDSISAQKYREFEVLLIDDGSTDESTTICERQIEKDHRFIYYKKNNGGVSSARNLGIKKAHGKYILFIDSDDWIESDLLSDSISELEKTNADMFIFGMVFDIEKANKVYRSITKQCSSRIFDAIDIDKHFLELSKNNYLTSMCNKLIRLDVIRDNQILFDERITNYEDLLFSLLALNKIRTVQVYNKCYYHYVLRDELGMSRKYKPKLTETIKTMVTELRDAIYALPLSEKNRSRACNILQSILWLGVANICRAKQSILRKKEAVHLLCSQMAGDGIIHYTQNKYNNICVFLAKVHLWYVLIWFNCFANFIRDKRY